MSYLAFWPAGCAVAPEPWPECEVRHVAYACDCASVVAAWKSSARRARLRTGGARFSWTRSTCPRPAAWSSGAQSLASSFVVPFISESFQSQDNGSGGGWGSATAASKARRPASIWAARQSAGGCSNAARPRTSPAGFEGRTGFSEFFSLAELYIRTYVDVKKNVRMDVRSW